MGKQHKVLKKYLKTGGDLNKKIPEDFMGVNLDTGSEFSGIQKRRLKLTYKNRIKKLEELDNWQWHKISDFEKWKMAYDEVLK